MRIVRTRPEHDEWPFDKWMQLDPHNIVDATNITGFTAVKDTVVVHVKGIEHGVLVPIVNARKLFKDWTIEF